MTGEGVDDKGEAVLQRVTALITEAIDLLDAHQASQPAATHLALALQELQEARARLDKR